jgi:hypothetical protein
VRTPDLCLTPALCFLEAAGTPLPELSACPSPAAAPHCSHIRFGSRLSGSVCLLIEASTGCRKFDSDNQLPTAAAAAGARRAPRERKQQRGGVKETAAPKAASTAATATDAEAPGQELRPAVRHCCPTCPLSDQQPQWRGSAHSQVPRARVPHAKPRARAHRPCGDHLNTRPYLGPRALSPALSLQPCVLYLVIRALSLQCKSATGTKSPLLSPTLVN